MDCKRPTIIDFVEHYAAKHDGATFLREKVDGAWTETSFMQTRNTGRQLAAGFMALGLNKGDKVAICARNQANWGVCFLADLPHPEYASRTENNHAAEHL